MTKVVSSATQTDANVCNALVPPTRGADAGGGIHIVIPANFAALIAQGVDVPGCTYARVEADGTLVVSDQVQAQLAVPADVKSLPAADVADLAARLAAAVSVATADRPAVVDGEVA
jgi:hypothetical protein